MHENSIYNFTGHIIFIYVINRYKVYIRGINSCVCVYICVSVTGC